MPGASLSSLPHVHVHTCIPMFLEDQPQKFVPTKFYADVPSGQFVVPQCTHETLTIDKKLELLDKLVDVYVVRHVCSLPLPHLFFISPNENSLIQTLFYICWYWAVQISVLYCVVYCSTVTKVLQCDVKV